MLLIDRYCFEQWKHYYNYTVENSALYVYLPISFKSPHYIIQITDGSVGCIIYGATDISASKC